MVYDRLRLGQARELSAFGKLNPAVADLVLASALFSHC